MKYVSTNGVTPPTAWCAVYDSKTGEIVHVHGFTGFDFAAESEWGRAMRKDMALAHVRMHVRKDGKGLEVVHGDPKKLPKPGERLSFDLKKSKLVVTRGLGSIQEHAKRRSKPASGKPVKNG